MRQKLLFFAASCVLFFACSKDEDVTTATNQAENGTTFLWSADEQRFFDLDQDFFTKTRTRDSTDTETFRFHPQLLNLHRQIALENEQRSFIDSFVYKFGVPLWRKALIYQNAIKTEFAIVLQTTDGVKTTGVIVAIKKTNIQGFDISFTTRKKLYDQSIPCAYYKKIFGRIFALDDVLGYDDNTLYEAYCACEQSGQINPPNTDPDCEWKFMEICQEAIVYIGGTSILPPFLDHDRDGIRNEDDQDWHEWSIRHNVSQEEIRERFFKWWEEKKSENFDVIWDENIEDIWWWDWDEWWDDENGGGSQDGDPGGYRDENGNGQDDRYESDLPCPFGDVQEDLVGSRTECEYVYAKICDGNNQAWYLGDHFNIEDIDQQRAWMVSQIIAAHPYLLNYFTQQQILDASLSCDMFSPHFEQILLITLAELYGTPHDIYGQMVDRFLREYGAEKFFFNMDYYIEMKSKGVSIDWDDILEGMSWEKDKGQDEEIQTDITIMSIWVPTANIIPGTKVCETEYRHLHNPPSIIAPDMKSGTNADLSLLSDRHADMPNMSDNQLRWYMTELIQWTSKDPLEAEAEYFISRFINGTGIDYFSSVMSQAAKDKNTTHNFIKTFGAELNERLRIYNGNINNIPLIYFEEDVTNGHPVYNDSNTEGLRIMMNDTEYSKIHTQAFTYDAASKEWSGMFYIEVYDHFGLDDIDLERFQNATLPFTFNDILGKGFAAWWLLQHHRGKKPFRTQMKFIVNLKGKL